MKVLLIISAFTSISAIRVPSIWQTQPNTNLDNVNQNVQPIRHDVTIAQPLPNFNNINGYAHNPTNVPQAGLIVNGNLFSNIPVDYGNWFGPRTPALNNGLGFAAPVNQIVSGKLLGEINPFSVGRNEARRKPPVQQRPGPPRLLHSQRNYNKSPDGTSYQEIPGKVPYITFTTQRPAEQQNSQFVQNSGQNVIRQAYPQVTSPKTTVPLTELDFSPRNPFPVGQQDGQASTQVSNQNILFSTSQPVNNLDFSLNNPFPRNSNGYQVTQFPQASTISHNPIQVASLKRRPKYNIASTPRGVDFNPFVKNYRDHRTHEPTEYDAHYDREAVPVVERLESEKAPVVQNHEYPGQIPTKPIYPGEAQWSKPGAKHRPFVSQQQYKNLEESSVEPDGYDTFLEAQKLFENQKRQFGDKLQQYPGNNNAHTHQSSTEQNSNEAETFVPTRLYAQVRHSEDEKHLPPESDGNGRLKELVKDTKIQTIYSEEGYEDSAYDHAGHEKSAENNEGFESDDKKEEVKEKKRVPVKKYDRESASYSVGDQNLSEKDIEKLKEEDLKLDGEDDRKDSEPAGTHYEEQSYLNKIKPVKSKPGRKKVDANAFVKEIKTVTAKDKGGKSIEMEISSEVKAVVQPNNSTKVHKYVKIYPKINKVIEGKDFSSTAQTQDGRTNPDAERRSLNLNSPEIFIEEVITRKSDDNLAEYVSTTVTPTEYAEVITMEIPITTQATTAIPKTEIRSENRRKRSASLIPKIEVDTDFIDEINHDIGKPTEKSKEPDQKKYPYYLSYKQKGLHEDSPLRYSEDLQKTPVKVEGRLAFYDNADRKMSCPDVNPEADPVPDRIQNADESVEDEEEDEEGNDPATKDPRLGGLGDKIDCFKAKYFGENPLDNPFFQEELVGPIKPIFSEIDKISTKNIGSRKVGSISKGSSSPDNKIQQTTSTQAKINKERLQAAASNDIENEVDDGKSYKYGLTGWFPGKNFQMGENTERDSKFVNHFVDKNPNLKVNDHSEHKGIDKVNLNEQNLEESSREIPTLPPLITTPKYTIDLKPKHIYDQIELLEYLPEDEFEEVKKQINADLPKINLTDVTTSLPNTNKTETALNAPLAKKKNKKKSRKNKQRKGKVLKSTEESMKMETSDNGKPESVPEVEVLQLVRPKPNKPLFEIFDINEYLPEVPKIRFSPPRRVTENPKYIAPVSIVNPTLKVFDINKYIPTTPFPIFKDFITRSTVLPKFKVISEVFYKEDIKPNEQMNVFTDVLNNIRNFPKLRDSFPQSSEPISVKLNAEKILEKYPQQFFERPEEQNEDHYSSTITTIMTTFDPKMYASNHKYVLAEEPTNVEKSTENSSGKSKSKNKRKRRRRIKTTTQDAPMVIEESTSTVQYIGEPTEVMGLMPPLIQGYKTIYHPKRDNSEQIAVPTMIVGRKINKYYVRGMRPPPKQKVFLYSDFLTDNQITRRMSRPRRAKRSAQRPAYAQLSRNKNKQPETTTEVEQETKEEEDDYVPHRPKNYHYDEKTGKIVYDKKPQEEVQEEDEEVEYIEVVEETPQTTSKPKQNPIFATATPPPQGESYTDFVKLLKSASGYKEIPDPTTTEKGAEEITQKVAASTLDPVSTTAPEFLSILAKVRNDSNYKLIEDAKKAKATEKQPEEINEETETEEEESQVEDIRNSPGGQDYEQNANLEIFDISDFLPNIKSYLPKTSIDTSKYKTIERPHLRHSLSSRYNSDEEKDLQNVNTNKNPILPNDESSEKQSVQKSGSIVSTTTTSPLEVSTPKILRSSNRRRTTTQRTDSSEEKVSATEATTTNHEPVAHHDKARRNYRRRPVRIKVKPTTDNNLEADATTKVIRRRTERDSHMYADSNEKFEQVIEGEDDLPKPFVRTDDYVDYVEIPYNSNDTDTEQLDNTELVTKKMVDIFQNYDESQKHGGNYKHEGEVNNDKLQKDVNLHPDKVEIFKAYDKTKKHGGNYRKEDDVQKDVVQPAVVNQDKVKDSVVVFKAYDETKKHGGNYRKEEELQKGAIKSPVINQDKVKDSVEVFKSYDKTKKHGGNYRAENDTVAKRKDKTKPILVKIDLKDIKKVEVFKDYDKTKKHGGNYIPANEGVTINQQIEPTLEKTESIQIENVNVFQDYDNTKRHGGNYKALSDTEEKAQIEKEAHLLKDVQVFQEYDQNKKHGGNDKAENNEELNEQQLSESQLGKSQTGRNILNDGTDKKSSVGIFKKYDSNKKTGGNYISEHDKEKTIEKPQIDSNKDVEVFQNYNKEKKTGGNYRKEEDSVELKADETHYSKAHVPQQKRYIESRNDVQTLADVVSKPNTFYSDLKLPLDINALKIVKDLSHDEIEEIAESAEEDINNKEEELRQENSTPVAIHITTTPSTIEKPVTAKKKPLIIKDPSKRLYFYAPIRYIVNN